MKISLIICTYRRPQALLSLLLSIEKQVRYPNEILIIDGSIDNDTKSVLISKEFAHLTYYKVSSEHRGLTRQRNYGVQMVAPGMEIIAFLDDDTILQVDYFKELEQAFESTPQAIGIGGMAINENRWKSKEKAKSYPSSSFYSIGDYVVEESLRNRLRNKLGLQSSDLPGIMPAFSNGRTYSYPLTGNMYPVDLLVGMSMSYRSELFTHISFSEYFNGYGLYEDADFSLRALSYGQNYIHTKVLLEHHHDPNGRPDMYKYGKMVLRNGWYVWRIKYPATTFDNVFKWHATALLLTLVRISNCITGPKRMEAFKESIGRIAGWWSLIFNKPIVQK